jgi:radical SAM protein with 4Fe4S-binding SPASM domain
MSAEIAPGFNYQRRRLADVVPLGTPFTFLIAPSQLCNLRCFYCNQGKDRRQLARDGFKFRLMDWAVFSRTAEQLAQFPERLKLIFFSGLGEPLLHRRLPEMVARLRELDAAERLEIFSNGLLLTKETSQALVDAGLTRLRVSLQGLSSTKYRQVAGVAVDFEELRDRLAGFYAIRRQCKLYVKVIDAALEPGEEERFYEMFRDLSDQMYVERFVPYQVSMGDYDKNVCTTTTVYGDGVLDAEVCPEPFFNWQVDLDGDVFPCCPLGLPKAFAVGNVRDATIPELWNAEKARRLRLALLRKERSKIDPCRGCHCYLSKLTPADRLDDDAERLIPLFERARPAEGASRSGAAPAGTGAKLPRPDNRSWA